MLNHSPRSKSEGTDRRRRTSPGRRQARLVTALLAVFMLAGSSAAHAANFTVNTTSDNVDANPGDGVCAASSGPCTLRAAIQEANALGGAHTISLYAYTYKLSIGGRNEEAAATGDLDITASLNIGTVGGGRAVIDARGLDRVFDVHGGAVVWMNRIVIQGGNVDINDKGSYPIAGGGLRNAGALRLAHCVVAGNSATGSIKGGGIFNARSLTITNSFIDRNRSDHHAGGIANDAASLTITDSAVRNNSAYTSGGGLHNDGAFSRVSINNSTVSGNSSEDGAGMANYSGEMVLTNCTISSNVATANSASPGDGIGIYSNSKTALINCTVAGNVLANASPNHVGIHLEAGTATVRYTIVADGGSGCRVNPYKAHLISEGYNIDQGKSCALNATGDMSGVNPNLGPLAGNGGPTQTHALLWGSPAIDAIPYWYQNYHHTAPGTDQRHVPRPQNNLWDIGAYELLRSEMPPTIERPPTATYIFPASARVRSDQVELIVEGDNFLDGATVYWEDIPLRTELLDSTSARAYVDHELLQSCGTFAITVRNRGGEPSNHLPFEVHGCEEEESR